MLVYDAMDENAPVIAGVAADAVDLLNDATDAAVGFPGLDSLRDLEAVLAALGRLADELQDTTRHLEDYLSDDQHSDQEHSDQHDHDRSDRDQLVGGSLAGGPAGAVVGALLEVRRVAGRLSTAIAAAELATLQLQSH